MMEWICYKNHVSGAYHGIQIYNKLAYINHGVLCKSVIMNYVSEHQLPHVVNASHTTPTTYVNWAPMLLKLIGGDIVHVLSGSCIYPGPQTMLLALNEVISPGTQYMNNNNINMEGCQSSSKILQWNPLLVTQSVS